MWKSFPRVAAKQELSTSDELATAKANNGYECDLVVTTPNSKVEKNHRLLTYRK